MNTRKPRWLVYSNCIVNLDRVDAILKADGGVNIFSGGRDKPLFIKDTTIDDVHHYLKYGKPKRR
jgi:hypothetical protein